MMVDEVRCSICEDDWDAEDVVDGVCFRCRQKSAFAAFAEECGLTRYPRPDGERYIYRIDGHLDGKKSECTDYIDELWNVLAKIKGRSDMVIGGG